MRTVYVLMYSTGCGDMPHSVFFSRKAALDVLDRIEKRSDRFYFIERCKMGEALP